jgi:hypothetical protein
MVRHRRRPAASRARPDARSFAEHGRIFVLQPASLNWTLVQEQQRDEHFVIQNRLSIPLSSAAAGRLPSRGQIPDRVELRPPRPALFILVN